VEQRFKILVNEKCKELEIGIIAIECDKDHVHMFLNCLPTQSPSDIMQYIKGHTSKVLRTEFDALNKMPSLWTRSYFVSTAGDEIAYQEPDCLAYESEARKGSMNFLFFEHGFKKLSLREVRLRLGDEKGKNHNRIICADTSDYSPKLYSYGDMFLPIARIGKDEQYNETDEFKLRLQVYMDEIQRIVDERPKKNSED